MKSGLAFLGTVFLSAALALIGCSKDHSDMTSPDATENFSISPADQSQNVRLDSKIVLSFAQSVDTKAVESGFHLISQSAMADSACPFSQTMNHGDMNMAMMDTMKMNHLDQNHSMTGSFTWNSTNTQCVFTPDSMMDPKMTYMVHIGKNMMDMMSREMGSMGSMMGSGMMGGTGQTTGHMLMHFTTMDTTNTGGSGHLGHH